jgi:hypothetical protein
MHEHETAVREKEIRELKAARAKLGLDENDITRPPEKWTDAMRSFVEYMPYGPPPPEEEKWEALTDMVALRSICDRVVSDAAVARQLQQWCDGKAKVYKVFLARALEATEDKAPVQLLRQALNAALGEFREVDEDLLILAMGAEDAAKARAAHGRTKRGPKPGAGEGVGGDKFLPSDASAEGDNQGKKNGGRREGKDNRRKKKDGGEGGGEGGGNLFNERSRMRNLRVLEEKISKGEPLNDDEQFG